MRRRRASSAARGLGAAALAALALSAGSAGAARAAVVAEWAERWRSDLAFVADTLPKVHPNLYHSVSRERFRAALDSLSRRVPALEHHQIAVELARVMALVSDGHTRLTLPFDSAAGFFTGHGRTETTQIPGLVFHHLPVRLRSFADGLYVVRAGSAQRELLGGKVVELGGMPIAQAIAAVSPTVQRDNDQQVRDLLPTWLVVPEILQARGVAPSVAGVRIVVETPGGRREATLAPAPAGAAVDWIDARDPGPPPLAERHPERRHWFERVPGTTALYARYREVMDDEGRTVADFADSLFRALDGPRADRLILDLRGNVGGNGFLNGPLLRGIIAARDLQGPAHLFVLADRGTFSAAMMLLAQLERFTPAVTVGEKSGGRPNSYGDSRRVRLPATGLTVRVSTLYWQMTDPRDPRDGITPLVAVEPTFADWRARRDPVLDSTLALMGPPADPAGEWRGALVIDDQQARFRVRVQVGGASRRASIEAPDLGLEETPLRDVSYRAGELRFALRGQGPPWEFRGHVTAGAIVGVVRFQGNLLPFVMRRTGAGMTAPGAD